MGPEMVDHYAKYRLENRYKQLHVRKIVHANWKLAMEAFTESYHVFASHPQLLLEGRETAALDRAIETGRCFTAK